ncbi:basic helix-loop-helix protein [Corynascus similis CBS 632.67]
MSGATTSSSTSFDPYTTSFESSCLQTLSNFSPVSVFSTEDFGTDFASDSATSPLSPLSPALSASSFGLPSTDAWAAWDSAELSPEPDNLFGCQTLTSCPPTGAPLSPAINPLDLSLPAIDAPTTMIRFPQTMPAPLPDQIPAAVSSLPTTIRRYPSRGPKRTSSTSALSDSKAPATKPTTAAAGRRASAAASTKPRNSTATTPGTATPTALGPRKSAHNMIEKRYRTNLNDKITRLRDAVPSLRQLAQRVPAGSASSNDEDAAAAPATATVQDGSTTETTPHSTNGASNNSGVAAAKLNKATILSRATEYIVQLERRNQALEAENGALRGRMEGLEVLLMGRAAAVAASATAAGACGRGQFVTGWE